MRAVRRTVVPIPVAEPGDGGVGHSWFAIELTSEHVDPGTPGPVRPPSPGPVPRVKPRKQTFEDRFDGVYTVVETVTERFGGRITVVEPARFAGVFDVTETTTQAFSASYEASTLRHEKREEELIVLMMMDD